MATGFDFASLGNLFAPGGTPTGLDALFNEDQRRLMRRNANLSAAAALLQASGRSRERIGLGQALGSALQAGQQGYQQARAGSLQDLLLGQKLAESQAARARQADIERIIGTGVRPAVAGMPSQMVEEDGRFLGETPAIAARPAGFDIQAIAPQLMAQGPEGRKAFGDLLAAQKTLMGDTFSLGEGVKQYVRDPITGAVREVAAGTPKPTETVGSPFQGQDGKFYIQTKTGGVIPALVAPMAKPVGRPQQVMGANNKPQLVQYYEDGSYKAVSGVSPLIPRERIDTGSGILVQDPYSIPSGTVIPKGLAPQVVGNSEDGYFVVGGGGGAARGGALRTAAPGSQPSTTAPSTTPPASGPVPLIPGTGKSFAREKDLRSEYTREMKPFTDLSQAFSKVEAAALNPSAAGDISLVYGYMKILDPGSTVMQGEQATATNAGSVPDRVRAQYNKALTGQGLIDEIRQDFYAQSRNLIESQRQLQQDIAGRYTSIATQNNLNPNQVIFDPFQRIRTPAQIAADAAKEKKKKPFSYTDTYNLTPRN